MSVITDYIKVCPAMGLMFISNSMEISPEARADLQGAIEDTIEYCCDHWQLSGELAWTVIECFAAAKLAEINGELVYQ